MATIRKISIDILNYLENNILPPHKRQTNRLAWLKGLLQPMQDASTAFDTWRNEMIIAAMVTGQTASLQWYLNYKLDTTQQRILITHGIVVGDPVSLSQENADCFTVGLSSETGTVSKQVGLEGENITSLPYDFRVIAPSTIDQGQIKKIVDTYKQCGKLYDIQTF